jgi:hypothetical protein
MNTIPTDLPTKEELEEKLGVPLCGAYQGPLTYKYAIGCFYDLKNKINEVTGKPTFPGIQIVAQDNGFNVVYVDDEEKAELSEDPLERLIQSSCTQKLNERDRTYYEGYCPLSIEKIGEQLPKEFHQQNEWRSAYVSTWFSENHLTIIGWSENTLSVSKYKSAEAYQAGTREIRAFYRKHR